MTVAEWCGYWLNEIDSRNVRPRDARRYYKNAVEQAKGVDCPEEIRDKQKQTAELMGSLLDWL